MNDLWVTGDLHCSPFGECSRAINKDGLTFLGERTVATVRWLTEQVGPGSLLINGDYTDVPGVIDSATLVLLARVQEQLTPLAPRLMLNVGNHDLSSISGRHNLELHKALGVRVAEKVTEWEYTSGHHVYVSPFTPGIAEQLARLSAIPDGAIVAVHFPIKGIAIGVGGIQESEGIPQEYLRRFRLVIASHYHTPQILSPTGTLPLGTYTVPNGTILVTGAPMANSFADVGLRGVWQLELSGSNNNITLHSNPESPVYLRESVSSSEEAHKIIDRVSKLPHSVLSLDTDDIQLELSLRKEISSEKRVRLKRASKLAPNVSGFQSKSLLDGLKEYVERQYPDRKESLLGYIEPIVASVKAKDCTSPIVFKSVLMSNFFSIERATLALDTGKLTLVAGINHDPEFAQSNGSGKSALLASIHYALFGTTDRGVGVTDVIRRGTDECIVKLKFTKGGHDYLIVRRRTIKKAFVSFWCDGEDISCTNPSDTDTLIRSVVEMDQRMYSILTYLSQGFNTKFTSLSDADKKLVLEQLLGLSAYDSVANKIKDLYKSADQAGRLAESEHAAKRAAFDTMQAVLRDAVYTDKQLDDERLEELSVQLHTLSQITEPVVDPRLEKVSQRIYRIDNRLEDLSKLSTDCPECGQPLDPGIIEERATERVQLLGELDSLVKERTQLTDDRKIELENVRILREKKAGILSQYAALEAKISEKTAAEFTANKRAQKTAIELELATASLANVKDKLAIASLASEVFASEGLRAYLSEASVATLCEYLRTAALDLFGSEYVSVSNQKMKKDGSETNVISFRVQEGSYEGASGGERRKIDLAIHLAIGSMARARGVGSNLLIVDEVLDNLDSLATKSVMNVLRQLTPEATVFVISHSPSVVPTVDTTITIQKKSGVSRL